MKGEKYSLDKHNRILILVFFIFYIIKLVLFTPKNSYALGYSFGPFVFVIGTSFLVSFITWFLSTKNIKSTNTSFRITFYFLVVISVLRFVSEVGKSIQ